MPQSNEERAEYQRRYAATPEGQAARDRAAETAETKRSAARRVVREQRDYYAEHPPFGEHAITKDEYDAMIAEKEELRNLFGPPVYGHP